MAKQYSSLNIHHKQTALLLFEYRTVHIFNSVFIHGELLRAMSSVEHISQLKRG